MKLALAFLFLAAFMLPASESDQGASDCCGAPEPVTTTVAAPVAAAPEPSIIHSAPAPDEETGPQDEPEKDYEARKKEDDGVITGSVKFPGAVPSLPPLNMGDKDCKAMHAGAAVKSQLVIVNDNKTLRNTFVYISKGAKAWKCKAPEEPAVIDQKNCIYTPHVRGMLVGQSLKIKNSDAILHNIHGLPVANGNVEFNIGQPGVMEELLTPASKNKTFMGPEVMVRIKCDVHDWMSAYVGVRPNPFFSVTGEDGTFKITGVPPGKYELTAWHEFYGNKNAKPKATEPLKSKEITVEAGKTVALDFEFK